MKLATVAVVLASFCVTVTTASADSAKRMADLLSRDNISPNGDLASKTIASFEGCILKLTLDKLDACSRGASFGRIEKTVDLRVLMTRRIYVTVREIEVDNSRPLPGAALTYSYQWTYSQRLETARDTSSRILDEEYKRYPRDVDARLRTLSERYRKEINPDLYSGSKETTTYCSGVKTTSPLSSTWFTLYLAPENADEFISLFEDYAENCGSGATS